MNKIVSFLLICLLLADLHAQNTIKIIDKDKTSTPVSPYLWGSFFEMGFGRSNRRPSGLRKTIQLSNSLAHKTTWLRSDLCIV